MGAGLSHAENQHRGHLKTMSASHYGTPNYSPRDAARKSPRLSGATMPRELQERLRALADARGTTFSAELRKAAEEYLEREEQRTIVEEP